MHNILFYNWNVVNAKIILKNLIDLGYQVYEYRHALNNLEVDAEVMQEVIFMIHEKKIDCIFSINYIPLLSSIASASGIPYYSWAEDSPEFTYYSPTRDNTCNHIFTFDKEDYYRVSSIGCKQVNHLPLASDPYYFAPYIKKDKKYEADVCFLGSLYNKGEYSFSFTNNRFLLGFCEGLIMAQKEVYGCSFIENSLSEQQAKEILSLANSPVPEGYPIDPRIAASFILERKVSEVERREYLSKLGDRYNLTIYTGDKHINEIHANYKPFANYDTEMPKVFYNSKVNLHFTPRNIHSGISLRVFDVLACKGFLIASWQPEIAEYFEDGKELILFSDAEDLCEKVDFYLKNEDIRLKIAENGYKKICDSFTYQLVLREILRN